ncbi:hypothetical protein QN277_008557 [Acacia crassicarpa]|uniref:RNase H type-1 domain-containing protein n=1 Tax=Acacia crassicarpa TaxID=499986 RepID=A0AAE1IRX4_9FABA|nr:hypothetical protein QN277_008557 [Acacia crassicarpa]
MKQAVRWVPPEEHMLKVNLDGSFYDSSAAIGLVCRNHWGHVQWTFTDKVKSISAFMTEALALKRALMIAHDLRNKNVVFETDIQILLRQVENGQQDLCEWQSRSIIDDILFALKAESSFLVRFTPRQRNKAANLLAAFTNKEVCPVGWVGIPLPSLSLVLEEDRQSIRSHQEQVFEQPRYLDPG